MRRHKTSPPARRPTCLKPTTNASIHHLTQSRGSECDRNWRNLRPCKELRGTPRLLELDDAFEGNAVVADGDDLVLLNGSWRGGEGAGGAARVDGGRGEGQWARPPRVPGGEAGAGFGEERGVGLGEGAEGGGGRGASPGGESSVGRLAQEQHRFDHQKRNEGVILDFVGNQSLFVAAASAYKFQLQLPPLPISFSYVTI